jgi:hypothetical protein
MKIQYWEIYENYVWDKAHPYGYVFNIVFGISCYGKFH